MTRGEGATQAGPGVAKARPRRRRWDVDPAELAALARAVRALMIDERRAAEDG